MWLLHLRVTVVFVVVVFVSRSRRSARPHAIVAFPFYQLKGNEMKSDCTIVLFGSILLNKLINGWMCVGNS